VRTLEIIDSPGNALNDETIDVGIIVALVEEFRVLYPLLPDPVPVKDELTGVSDYLFRWPVKDRGPYRCVATFVGAMGPTEAALATERFLNRRRPKTIVMLGIAASISEDMKLGDVVVANSVGRYLDRAKIVPGARKSFEIRPGGDAFPCSLDLVQASLHFEFAPVDLFSQWQRTAEDELSRLVPQEKKRAKLIGNGWLRERPILESGPVASGPVVAAAEEFVSWVKSLNRNYLALEMEGGAVLASVYSRADPSRSLMLRGISDFGDQRKPMLDRVGKGGLRRYAMHNAVSLLWGLMEADVLPLSGTDVPPRHQHRRKRYNEEQRSTYRKLWEDILKLVDLPSRNAAQMTFRDRGKGATHHDRLAEPGYELIRMLDRLAPLLEVDHYKNIREYATAYCNYHVNRRMRYLDRERPEPGLWTCEDGPPWTGLWTREDGAAWGRLFFDERIELEKFFRDVLTSDER
jgi:nucleoside phosphorylase